MVETRRRTNEVVSIITEMKEGMKPGESKSELSNDDKRDKVAKKRPKSSEEEDADMIDKIPRKQVQQQEGANNILERLEAVKTGLGYMTHQDPSLAYNEILQVARQIDGNIEANKSGSRQLWSRFDEDEWYKNIQKDLAGDPVCYLTDHTDLSMGEIEALSNQALVDKRGVGKEEENITED